MTLPVVSGMTLARRSKALKANHHLLLSKMSLGQPTLVNFAIVALVVTLVPGPAFITVLSTALRRGFRSALHAVAGVVAGDAFYFLLTSLGLGSLLTASYWAFTIIKAVGIIYLVYLLLAVFATRARSLLSSPRAARLTNRISGAAMWELRSASVRSVEEPAGIGQEAKTLPALRASTLQATVSATGF